MKDIRNALDRGLSRLTFLTIGVSLLSAPVVAQAPFADTTPPHLFSLSFNPTSVDVSSSPATVTLTLHVGDDLSGIDFATVNGGHESYVVFQGPAPQYQYQTIGLQSFSRIDPFLGDLDTTWQGTFTMPKLAEAGSWQVASMALYDKAGNSLYLNGDALNYLGIPDLTVVSTVDVTPPQILSFEFTDGSGRSSANMVTVTAFGRQWFLATMHVTDDNSGVGQESDPNNDPVDIDEIEVRAQPPPGVSNEGVDSSWQRISGTPQDGILQGWFSFPQYSPAGLWTIQAAVRDNAGNWAYFNSYSLGIVDTPVSLFSATEILNLPFFAAQLLAQADNVSICLFGQLSPATQDALINYKTDPSTADTLLAGLVGDLNALISGPSLLDSCAFDWNTFRDETVALALMNPPARGNDLLALNRLLLEDAYPLDLSRSPQSMVSIYVADVYGASDSTPPSVRSVELSPITIDTSVSDQTVTVVVDVRDDLSGVDHAYLYLSSPSGGQSHYLDFSVLDSGSTQPDPSDPLRWRFSGTVVFPQYSEAGTWEVRYISAGDAAGNYLEIDLTTPDPSHPEYSALAATLNVIKPSLGIDGTVTPGGGGTVTDQTFGDRAEITFPPNAVSAATTVAIDVLSTPLDVPTPTGFVGVDTYYVNIHLDPTPNYPLTPPGLTVVLPLVSPLPEGTRLDLFRINTSTGLLEPSLDVFGGQVRGSVDATGLRAVFSGVSRLSTVVGLLAAPVITWDVPADISYGTALSVQQLNAAADIPGKFAYSPPLGTVLNASQAQALTATFTPDDAVHYPGSFPKSVTINVTKVPLKVSADDKVMLAGAVLPVFTASYDGFVNNETPANLTQPPVIGTTATASSPAGKYDINASGAVDDNYDITYVKGTLTVLARGTVDLHPVSYPLKSSKRISQTVWEYTYKFVLKNQGEGDATQVSAQLATWPAQVTVVQGSVSFGNVLAGSSATSLGTFIIRVDRSKPVRNGDLKWTFSYTDPYATGKTVPGVPF
jgi:MBG domain (YGX type)